MIRTELRAAVLASATLFFAATAAAQIAPAIPRADPPPDAEPVAPPPVVQPPPLVPAPAAVVTATPAPPPALEDLTGALGFGVGVIPGTQLVGTSGAVSVKYWLRDDLVLAPLFSFGYDKPRATPAAWHLRPEMVVLFVPFTSRWTRFEVGGGVSLQFSKAASTINADGSTLEPNTISTIALPIQAGVEHFFARWFSLGIAARADLFAYSHDGDYHEVSFTIDSTSLLGQLFFYTD
jgi:hypothetical protein